MSDKIEQQIELPVDIEAPVEQGQTLGKLTLYIDGETVGEYKLVSDRYIKRLTFFEALKKILYSFKNKIS